MKLRVNAAAALALVALAGCGEEDRPPAEPPAPAAGSTDPRGEQEGRAGGLAVEADPSGAPAFRPASLRAEAGRVSLELVNLSQTAHSLCLESPEQGARGCTGTFRGDRGRLRLSLDPGSYTYFCGVPGHREAGMQGTLTVE